MPSFSERITISSPAQVVWRLLADPGLLASCIPGATLAPTSVVGVYDAAIRINFGSVAPVFRGEARISYDDHAMRCALQARCVDAEGKSRASASVAIAAHGMDMTSLTVEGDIEMTGPIAHVAAAQGGVVARALLAEFAENTGT
jgi:carbon monoxide dehydrogenase subunit G